MMTAEGISSTRLVYLIRNLNSVHCEFACSFFIDILTAVYKQEETGTMKWIDASAVKCREGLRRRKCHQAFRTLCSQ